MQRTMGRPMIGKLGWGVMTTLALIIAVYAIALLFVPAMRAPFLQERFATVPPAAPAPRWGRDCPRHRAVSAQHPTPQSFSASPSVDGAHVRGQRPARWSGGLRARDHVASGIADAHGIRVACGTLAVCDGECVPPHPRRRPGLASPLDDPELRADIRGGDAPLLSPAESDGGLAVRRRLSDDLVALLGSQSHRRRVDHPPAAAHCVDS